MCGCRACSGRLLGAARALALRPRLLGRSTTHRAADNPWPARVVKLVDTADLKSAAARKRAYGFDSRLGHHSSVGYRPLPAGTYEWSAAESAAPRCRRIVARFALSRSVTGIPSVSLPIRAALCTAAGTGSSLNQRRKPRDHIGDQLAGHGLDERDLAGLPIERLRLIAQHDAIDRRTRSRERHSP